MNPLDSLLIVDTETTGLDPEKHACIEVAAVMFSMDDACVIECFSTLVETNAPNEVEAINHIPQRTYQQWGMPAEVLWLRLAGMWNNCDAIVAHNSDFDQQWFPSDLGIHKLPWIDTCNGVNWPRQSREASNLISLAFEHGLGVVDPHRALSDCLLIARLLSRCAELGYDIRAILRRGLRPMGTFEALVSFEDKALAQEKGFKWKGKEAGGWQRKMATEDLEQLGFSVRRVS